MTAPRDVADLYLAPVALELDAELETLKDKDEHALLLYIALETGREPLDLDERRRFLLEAVTRLVDLHGWEAGWDERGLRLTNDEHTVVLGVPDEVRAYAGLR